MRPVNLIPSDERRGDSAPVRTGPVAYLIVAGLALVLLLVTATTLLGRDLNEKESELAGLEQRQAAAEARATSLAPFVSFQQMKEARVETVRSLAESRFDWERVMQELALVLPKRVWLTELSGSVAAGGGGGDGGGDSGVAASIEGPTLQLQGCARSQRDIARLVTSLEDIDGATRVLAERGEKPSGDSGGSGGGEEGGGGDCQTRDFVPKFTATVAFDAVAIEASVPPTTPDPPADAAPTSADGGVAETNSERNAAKGSVAEANRKTGKAQNLLEGGSDAG